jgi:hypothetical protein
MNETSLPLTESQIKMLNRAKKQNKSSVKLKLSSKQVKQCREGGFLPALIAGVPAITSLLASVYNSYQNKKANDRLVEERIRHNRVLESEGGKGLYMSRKPRALRGEGVVSTATKKKKDGKGLYMGKKPRALGGNALMKELLLKKKTLR